MKADGGDLELMDIEGKQGFCGIEGKFPLLEFRSYFEADVEAKLREFVSDDIQVEEVRP